MSTHQLIKQQQLENAARHSVTHAYFGGYCLVVFQVYKISGKLGVGLQMLTFQNVLFLEPVVTETIVTYLHLYQIYSQLLKTFIMNYTLEAENISYIVVGIRASAKIPKLIMVATVVLHNIHQLNLVSK